jgi:hypothetical protein
LTRFHPKRPRELIDDADRRVAGTSLDVADVRSMNARFISKCFLTEVFRLSQASNIPAQPLTNIHAKEREQVSIIVLQTMSDIAC